MACCPLSLLYCCLEHLPCVQGVIVAIENQQQRYYGLQYHPEVKHTDRGMETLKHFLFGIAKLNADWKLENILEEELEKLRRQVCRLYANLHMNIDDSVNYMSAGPSAAKQNILLMPGSRLAQPVLACSMAGMQSQSMCSTAGLPVILFCFAKLIASLSSS